MALEPTLILKDSTTFSDEISFSVTDSLTDAFSRCYFNQLCITKRGMPPKK